MAPPEERRARPARPGKALTLGDAIRACYEKQGLTQVQVAGALNIDQATLSRYVRNTSRPTLETINAIERACRRPHGWILAAAGYTSDEYVPSVRVAIEMDPNLGDQAREMLLRMYESALDAGA